MCKAMKKALVLPPLNGRVVVVAAAAVVVKKALSNSLVYAGLRQNTQFGYPRAFPILLLI